jgi:hypothetical protein
MTVLLSKSVCVWLCKSADCGDFNLAEWGHTFETRFRTRWTYRSQPIVSIAPTIPSVIYFEAVTNHSGSGNFVDFEIYTNGALDYFLRSGIIHLLKYVCYTRLSITSPAARAHLSRGRRRPGYHHNITASEAIQDWYLLLHRGDD